MRRALAAAALAGACTQGPAPVEVPELVFELAAHWQDRVTYPGLGEGRVVTTNGADDTVSLFDLSRLGQPDLGELARVPVGLDPVQLEGPHHAALDPSGELYYVGISNYAPGSGSGPHGAQGTGTADGHVLKIRSSDNKRIASVRVDRNPGDLAADAAGRKLYVTHYDVLRIIEVARKGGPASEMDARLAVIDAATMTLEKMVPLCPAPHGLAFSPDGTRLYAACHSDEVAVVQLDDPAHPVRRVRVGFDARGATNPKHAPYALAVSPTTGEVWISCLASRQVRVLDPSTLTVDDFRTVYLVGLPGFGDFTSDGATVYVPHQGTDRIAVIDAQSSFLDREIVLPLADCQNVHAFRLAPGGRFGLVVCEGNHTLPGSILVLDMNAGGAVVSATPVGVYPDFVGVLSRRP